VTAQAVRALTLGFRSLLADYYWLKAIQIFGLKERTDEHDRALYHTLEAITDLDPKFAYPYRFAGTSLPRRGADGKWRNVAGTLRLLEKGIEHRPDVWHIPFYLGYTYSWFYRDYVKAAEALKLAALAPGRPEFVPLLATRMAAHGGQLELAEDFAKRMFAEIPEEDEKSRKEWWERLLHIQMEKVARMVDALGRQYEQDTGEPPVPLYEKLNAKGWLKNPEILKDPEGRRFEWDVERHEVRLPGERNRLRISERMLKESEREEWIP
jgi:hypothetical protein